MEREAAIKEAALRPKIHAEIWRKYNASVPPDAELEYRLENDWSFNRKSIKGFIDQFKATIAFAKLVTSDKVSLGAEDTLEDDLEPRIKVGDYIQWESMGQIQFVEPKRVTGFSDDGQYLFVEGGLTGIPIAEVDVEEPPAKPPKPPIGISREVPRAAEGNIAMRQDTISLDEGDAIIRWPTPLSKESLEDIEAWLTSVKRRITRSLKTESPSQE